MENKLSPYDKAKDLVRRCYQVVPNFDSAKDIAGMIVYELIEDRLSNNLSTDDLDKLRIEVYALGSPHEDHEARADRFNQEDK
jgi:hypothetical protein